MSAKVAMVKAAGKVVNALESRFVVLDRAIQAWNGTRSSDSLHELRVATRRAVAAIDFANGLLPTTMRKRQREVLRSLQESGGLLRDCQVSIAVVESLLVDHPILRSLLERLRHDEEGLRAGIERKIATAAKRVHCAEIAGTLRAALAPLLGSSPDAMVRHVERVVQRDLLRVARRVEREADKIAAHEVRVAAKRLRYAVEIIAPLAPQYAKPLIYDLRTVQDALGHAHDRWRILELLQEEPCASATLLRPVRAALRTQVRAQRSAGLAALTMIDDRWSKFHVQLRGPQPLTRLYLLRHAPAVETGRGGPNDSARQLTAKGRTKMNAIAKGLAELRLSPDVIVSSPAQRCRTTAAIVRRGLAHPSSVLILKELSIRSATTNLVRRIRDLQAQAKDIMIVGHEPSLGLLIAYLTGGRHVPLLKKGGLCCVDVYDLDHPGSAHVAWVLGPSRLRLYSSSVTNSLP
jgi:phosphohistidine phosphatase